MSTTKSFLTKMRQHFLRSNTSEHKPVQTEIKVCDTVLLNAYKKAIASEANKNRRELLEAAASYEGVLFKKKLQPIIEEQHSESRRCSSVPC